jgi:hypothetical protein
MLNEDYLWDQSGPPDAEIERLEQTLSALRQPAGRPAWLAEFVEETERPAKVVPFAPRRRWRQMFLAPQFAVAAVAACCLAGGLWFWQRQNAPDTRANGFVATLTRAPQAATPSIPQPPAPPEVKPREIAPARVVKARFVKPRRAARHAPPTDEATLKEGRQALKDLGVAMRVLNDKLNLAQKTAAGQVISLNLAATSEP